MSISLNTDSFEIKNHELTPEGFLKIWFVGGVPDKELVYENGVKEVINEDALFDQNSVNTAVGKLITFNHPPQAINGGNYREFAKGTVLQEFHKDPKTNSLVMSGIVHDSELVSDILSGRTKYVSAGYLADKIPNEDGTISQLRREYNHFSFLSPEYEPRAGEESKIIILGNTDQKEAVEAHVEPDVETDETSSPNPFPKGQSDTPKPQPAITPQNMDAEIKKRVEILTQWKDTLDSNNKAYDYKLDSTALKKLVLSCHYPQKTIDLLSENNNQNLDGFWIKFLVDNENGEFVKDPLTKEYQNDSMNFDTSVEKYRSQFIAKISGK